MTALPIPNPLASHREVVRQMASFGAIGVASTLACVALDRPIDRARDGRTPVSPATATLSQSERTRG